MKHSLAVIAGEPGGVVAHPETDEVVLHPLALRAAIKKA